MNKLYKHLTKKLILRKEWDIILKKCPTFFNYNSYFQEHFINNHIIYILCFNDTYPKSIQNKFLFNNRNWINIPIKLPALCYEQIFYYPLNNEKYLMYTALRFYHEPDGNDYNRWGNYSLLKIQNNNIFH